MDVPIRGILRLVPDLFVAASQLLQPIFRVNGTNSGTATATPVGLSPFTYSWTGGQTSQTATNLGAGAYTVTMTDNSGCVATANVTITAPPVLSGTTAFTNVTCNGVCNGTITVTPAGGVSPYQYSLNGGAYQASNSFTGLCAGAYNITIRDANNCTVVVSATITQPTPLALSVASTTPATCGLNNGAVTVSGSGGTINYVYNIGGANQASPTFSGLAPGSYTVTMDRCKWLYENCSGNDYSYQRTYDLHFKSTKRELFRWWKRFGIDWCYRCGSDYLFIKRRAFSGIQ